MNDDELTTYLILLLDRRIALALLSMPAVARTPGRLFATLGLLTAALSMWMSNVATTANHFHIHHP